MQVSELARTEAYIANREAARASWRARIDGAVTDEVNRAVIGEECSVCHSKPENTRLLFCAKCTYVPYCSKECQRIDWPVHRIACASFKVSLGNLDQIIEVRPFCVRALVDLPAGKSFRVQDFRQDVADFTRVMGPLLHEYQSLMVKQGVQDQDISYENSLPLVIVFLERPVPKWMAEAKMLDVFVKLQKTSFDSFIIDNLVAKHGLDKVKNAFNTVSPNLYKVDPDPSSTNQVPQTFLPRIACSMASTNTPGEDNCVFMFYRDPGQDRVGNLVLGTMLKDVAAGEELVAFTNFGMLDAPRLNDVQL